MISHPASHVLSWSQSQCVFHIETVSAMLTVNRQQFHGDRQTDFVPIFFGSDDECHAAARILRPTLIARRESKRSSVGASEPVQIGELALDLESEFQRCGESTESLSKLDSGFVKKGRRSYPKDF